MRSKLRPPKSPKSRPPKKDLKTKTGFTRTTSLVAGMQAYKISMLALHVAIMLEKKPVRWTTNLFSVCYASQWPW